jgi:hypothetical protein
MEISAKKTRIGLPCRAAAEALAGVADEGRRKVGNRVLVLLVAVASFAAPYTVGWPQARGPKGQPLATAERVLAPGWWPTKPTPRREEYVGPAACAECHSSEADVQKTTPMANASVRAANAKALTAHERLSLRSGPYVYDFTRTEGSSVFSVTNGERSVSAVLGWEFGADLVAETYIFERGGTFYEAQLSYFTGLQGLDLTPGHRAASPSDLDGAIGTPLMAVETRLCFGCHTTASSAGGKFDPEHLIPGITCEACHGPGAKHVAAMKAGRIADGLSHILNPAKLSPVDSVDFCGACHRSWADAVENQLEGIGTLRFQPYRLEMSRCWGKGDARLTCLACHDAHQLPVRDSASYDNRCLRCHLGTKASKGASNHPAPACPIGTKNCAGCHMPKVELPGTHAKFTDHWIRIVRAEKL